MLQNNQDYYVKMSLADYNRLIERSYELEQYKQENLKLKEEKLALEAEITDLKYGKVQLEQKISNEKGESTITQRPKCTTIKVRGLEGATLTEQQEKCCTEKFVFSEVDYNQLLNDIKIQPKDIDHLATIVSSLRK